MKVKRNVSLEDDVLRKGLKKGKTLGFNFSAYVTYLINKDCGEIAVTKEKVSDKAHNFIDSIVGND